MVAAMWQRLPKAGVLPLNSAFVMSLCVQMCQVLCIQPLVKVYNIMYSQCPNLAVRKTNTYTRPYYLRHVLHCASIHCFVLRQCACCEMSINHGCAPLSGCVSFCRVAVNLQKENEHNVIVHCLIVGYVCLV